MDETTQGAECTWLEDGGSVYRTDCGKHFFFDSGDPSENEFSFCPFCGRSLDDVTEAAHAD